MFFLQDHFIDKIIEKNQSIYLIGIGGISMSGIASILLDKGFKVSGSDMQENDLILKLRNAGCKINIGHNSENISASIIITELPIANCFLFLYLLLGISKQSTISGIYAILH